MDITHDKIDTEDGKKQDFFCRKIKLYGDLSDEQRKKLLEIANKCPVHRTMESNIRIDSALEEWHQINQMKHPKFNQKLYVFGYFMLQYR